MPDTKIDLAANAFRWGYKVVGDDAYGAVDLEFISLVSAAHFVNSHDIAHKVSLTFPDRVVNFAHPVMVTVTEYEEIFQTLS